VTAAADPSAKRRIPAGNPSPETKGKPSPGALRKRAYRVRVKRGQMTVRITIDADVVDWLARLNWLPPKEAYSPEEIAEAITAMLIEATRAHATLRPR
jgi:hypothetical protein